MPYTIRLGASATVAAAALCAACSGSSDDTTPTGPPVATSIVIATQPAGAVSGNNLIVQPVIHLRDADANLASSVTSVVTASITPGSATLGGTTTVTAVGGVATFTNLRITGPGAPSLTFAAGGLTPAVSAPLDVDTTTVARVLDSIRVAFRLPALAGAVVSRNGGTVMGAVGLRKYGGSTTVTILDKFHIGSMTKAMTAGVIGVLVDRGLLSWSTTLAQAFPDLVATMRPEYQPVTLLELLSQQSGLPRDPALRFTDATPKLERESLARWALQQPPVSPRGTYFYSNVNYMLAGTMAERATNSAFEQLITDRLFTPLGMTGTGFGAAGTPGAEDQPWQHYFDANNNRVIVPPGPDADNPPVYSAAGRVHLPIGTLARWIRTVLDAEGGQYGPWQPATARMLTTPRVAVSGTDSYALGWLTTKRSWAGPTQRVLTHDGTNTLSYSVAWLAPDAGWGVIVMTNQGGSVAANAADVAAFRLITLHATGK